MRVNDIVTVVQGRPHEFSQGTGSWHPGTSSRSRWNDGDPKNDCGARTSSLPHGQANLQTLRVNPSYVAADRGGVLRGGMSRRESRQSEAMAYRVVRDAHAKGIQAKYPIQCTPEGEPFGPSKTKWHAAIRAATERTLDYSVREIKRNPKQWKWALETIEKELDAQFSYNYPVKEGLLANYLASTTKDDHHQWKKHWLATNGGRHPSCPNEAFTTLDKYWRSIEGQNVSENMKEKRSLVGKRSRSTGSAPCLQSLSKVRDPFPNLCACNFLSTTSRTLRVYTMSFHPVCGNRQ